MKKRVFLAVAIIFALTVTTTLFLQKGKSREADISLETEQSSVAASPSEGRVTTRAKQTNSRVVSRAEGRKISDEEMEVQRQLAERSNAGEFILPSDNPFTVQETKERTKRAFENEAPKVMAARENFLASLNVDPGAISKLTNHAARIMEASMGVVQQLAEISIAKVYYDQKARELLTSEQYEQFKEFEMKDALGKEWKRDGIESFDNLSLNDIKGITQSLEEMGIREKVASTVLPYEPEPSSGNRITADERNPTDMLKNRISRVDKAAADLDVIAQRNQLSSEAKETLAIMIQNKAKDLREQLSRQPTPEEARAQFRARIESHLGRPLPDRK